MFLAFLFVTISGKALAIGGAALLVGGGFLGYKFGGTVQAKAQADAAAAAKAVGTAAQNAAKKV